ncbi:hypothetical protein HHX47_DHR3000800 [Lentinula edodes]|nr:hypothetical protein HHX47_DHR3000800 [Lentinula edodes]
MLIFESQWTQGRAETVSVLIFKIVRPSVSALRRSLSFLVLVFFLFGRIFYNSPTSTRRSGRPCTPVTSSSRVSFILRIILSFAIIILLFLIELLVIATYIKFHSLVTAFILRPKLNWLIYCPGGQSRTFPGISSLAFYASRTHRGKRIIQLFFATAFTVGLLSSIAINLRPFLVPDSIIPLFFLRLGFRFFFMAQDFAKSASNAAYPRVEVGLRKLVIWIVDWGLRDVGSCRLHVGERIAMGRERRGMCN